MITGVVIQSSHGGLYPMIEVSVRGSDGRLYLYEATVDTGFTGALTLPLRFINRIGLESGGSRVAFMADGRSEELDYYYAEVLWYSRTERVMVYQAEGDPLVGMDLLRGSRLTVNSWEGGAVAIEEAEG